MTGFWSLSFRNDFIHEVNAVDVVDICLRSQVKVFHNDWGFQTLRNIIDTKLLVLINIKIKIIDFLEILEVGLKYGELYFEMNDLLINCLVNLKDEC